MTPVTTTLALLVEAARNLRSCLEAAGRSQILTNLVTGLHEGEAAAASVFKAAEELTRQEQELLPWLQNLRQHGVEGAPNLPYDLP